MPSTLAMIQKIILPFLLKTLLLKSSRFLFYVFSPVLIQLACGFGRQNAGFLARFCCFILPHKPLFYKHLLQEINKFNKFSQNEHFSFSIADFFRGFLRRRAPFLPKRCAFADLRFARRTPRRADKQNFALTFFLCRAIILSINPPRPRAA
jgi:hypothetical protein